MNVPTIEAGLIGLKEQKVNTVMTKKYMLATFLNCISKLFGRKFIIVYFVVVVLLLGNFLL
jgi:hypothetical protein